VSFDDLEKRPLAGPGAARADERPQGADDAALASDHLAAISVGDVELDHHRVLTPRTDDANRGRLVHELLRQELDELFGRYL
jgi:hypothetical protein